MKIIHIIVCTKEGRVHRVSLITVNWELPRYTFLFLFESTKIYD